MSASSLVQGKIFGDVIVINERDVGDLFEFLPDSRLRALVSKAIEKRVITADDALYNSVIRYQGRLSLYMIAIALRLGANPNIYISNPLIGVINPIHILSYLYRSNNVIDGYFNMVILLLLHYGSLPTRTLYNTDTQAHNPSVLQWLNSGNYHHVLDVWYPNFVKVIDKATSTSLALLTGNKLLIGVPVVESMVENILAARTLLLLSGGTSMAHPTLKDSLGLDYMVVHWSLHNYDPEAVSYYANMGLLPGYVLITRLLQSLKQDLDAKNTFFVSVTASIIEIAVANGVIMDTEQVSYLEVISPTIHAKVMALYLRPYWTKACHPSTSGTVPPRLRTIALNLGVESQTYSSVCNELKSVSTMNKDAVLKSAKNRRLAQLGSKHGYVTEFAINNITPPTLMCVNRSGISGDYGDYSDINIASYRDDTGQMWCFISSSYRELLATKRNPSNNTLLPVTFIEEISGKLLTIDRLHMDEKHPERLSQSIDSIYQPDTPDTIISNHNINQMWKYVSREKFNISSLDEFLSSLGYGSSLSSLPRDLTISTFAFIVNHIINSGSPSQVKSVESFLRNMQLQ